jgi:hypothetical protein
VHAARSRFEVGAAVSGEGVEVVVADEVVLTRHPHHSQTPKPLHSLLLRSVPRVLLMLFTSILAARITWCTTKPSCLIFNLSHHHVPLLTQTSKHLFMAPVLCTFGIMREDQ